MTTFVILRRSGWRGPEHLQDDAARSRIVSDDEMRDDPRWIRSYVLAEDDGRLGSICVYEASSAEKVREHAERAGLPLDEVIPVADTVVLHPDPEPLEA